MKRIEIIQRIIDKGEFKVYLEIGTFRGKTFFPIKCHRKLAVDPNFLISQKAKILWMFRNKSNLRNRFFEMKSEEFFVKKKSLLISKATPDVIFIDGLHTFEASLKDVLSSLKVMNKNGVIVMHDCFPSSKAAATPAGCYEDAARMNIEGWTGGWNGDVWKTVVYLKERLSDSLEIIVLNTDHGIGILRLKKKENLKLGIHKPTYDRISQLDYDIIRKSPKQFLNLKDKNIFEEFLNTIN